MLPAFVILITINYDVIGDYSVLYNLIQYI